MDLIGSHLRVILFSEMSTMRSLCFSMEQPPYRHRKLSRQKLQACIRFSDLISETWKQSDGTYYRCSRLRSLLCRA